MGLLRRSNAFDEHLVSLSEPNSLGAEQYRRLRHAIEELGATRGVRVIAVTSAVAADGKTLTSLNLAGTLARPKNARVLLIDADLRQPAVARRLALAPAPDKGLLAAVEAPTRSLLDFVQPIDGTNLSVLATPASHADPYELLSGAGFRRRLEEARAIYDFVIVDTPPVIPVSDTGLLRRAVDGFLVVVAARSTPRRLLGEALSLLEPRSVIGLVYNRDHRPLFGYYRSRYRRYFRDYARSLDRAEA
jgi:capsular exopolysaccharide synthesis family protein